MNLALDIIFFIALILALVGAIYFLHRLDVRAKNKHKMDAYDLLDEDNPDSKKIKDTIRLLRAYGGRFRKDPEFMELIRLLNDLLDEIELTGKISKKDVIK